MTIIATILGVTSGFILAGNHRAPLNMVATSLAIDASLAPLTALIAARRGRSLVRWALAGFLFGLWAFVAVLLCGERRREQTPSEFPPTSDAA